MERSEILATMGELKLYGMKAAFDEILATAVERQHEPHRVVDDLLTAEISEKQARSIKYQIAIEGFPCDPDRMGSLPSCRWLGTSTILSSTIRRSTRRWCGISPAATSSPISATPS